MSASLKRLGYKGGIECGSGDPRQDEADTATNVSNIECLKYYDIHHMYLSANMLICSDMDQLKMMCREGKQFPMNLPPREYLEYFVSSYYQQLNRHQHRLFSLEQESKLTFREYAAEGEGRSQRAGLTLFLLTHSRPPAFWNVNVCSLQGLISYLDIDCNVRKPDPRCRLL